MSSPLAARASYFGEILLDDGDVALMDGGTHGVSGPTVEARADGSARWARRVDSMAPRGTVGGGPLTIAPSDRGRLIAWVDAAWQRAGQPVGPTQGPPSGPPRWVWAIAMRRGDEVRVLEGGATGRPDAEIAPALDWLSSVVDQAAADAHVSCVRLFVTTTMGDTLGIDEGETVLKETRGAEWHVVRADASGVLSQQKSTASGRTGVERLSTSDADQVMIDAAARGCADHGAVLAARRDATPWKKTAPGDALSNLKDVLSARWWLVATRRSGEVRVWDGKGDAPGELEAILVWLRARVR